MEPVENPIELSIVMPCLNEATTLERCLLKAFQAIGDGHITGEVIVADNGSTDGSQDIAQRCGAILVNVPQTGYGNALRAGISAAAGKYVIMADSDDSYDLSCIQPLVDKLRDGCQLVIGTRLKGTIIPDAMPALHRWLGNPLLTALGNLLFGTRLSDYHCGLRGFDREAILSLGLITPGMEFATEMIAKAAHARLSMVEIPIIYYPDGRSRARHLQTWRDGWRHLRFMLLLSPAWIFLYPGMLLILLGAFGTLILIPGPLNLGAFVLDVHTLLVCGVAIIVGVQILTFWLGARLFAANLGLLSLPGPLRNFMYHAPLASSLILGMLLVIAGLVPSSHAFWLWSDAKFGALNYQITLRWLIPGLVLMALGIHVFFAGFMVALLNFTLPNVDGGH